MTRDYAFDLDAEGPPALSIFGGKITTARRLAEHAMGELAPFFPQAGPAWTKDATLPGGEMEDGDFNRFLGVLRESKPFLAPAVALRLARAYGARVREILGDAASMADLGEDFGCGLSQAEIDYLMAHEWVQTSEDILWRRSKLGLHLTQEQQARVLEALEKV